MMDCKSFVDDFVDYLVCDEGIIKRRNIILLDISNLSIFFYGTRQKNEYSELDCDVESVRFNVYQIEFHTK